MELLQGTVVHLGCCKKQVHIQCYISKCPFCRAELPMPPNQPVQHVIVPIPVEIVRRQNKKGIIASICCVLGIIVPLVVFAGPRSI